MELFSRTQNNIFLIFYINIVVNETPWKLERQQLMGILTQWTAVFGSIVKME